MGSAIGAVLPLALGVALSPIPIIAVVLMLATPRGGVNGSSFLLGWLVGLSAVGTIVLLLSGGSGGSDGSGPATWVGVVSVLLGVALIVLAGLQWRRRPRGGTAALPGWMASIDRFSPVKSAGLGLALSAANPKNLLITVGAAAAIAQAGVSPGGQAVALGLFVLLGTLGPGVPLAIYVGLGARSQRILERLRGWMAVHNTAIMCVLLVVIGLKLVGDGISALVG
ncbi:GAP family protein [Actinomycetospora sp. CA-053990]|uniref:GAP family protein n=1 Tax=Actinomycetospora sp. CA-053990 TaxID=3239891 RepID=UPI003D91CF7A